MHSSFYYENWYLGTSELRNSRSFVYLCEKKSVAKTHRKFELILELNIAVKMFLEAIHECSVSEKLLSVQRVSLKKHNTHK